MTVPQPKVALNNACSVIFNNTLYTYSADAFQSLRLERGAEWEELPQGEKVTGGVCVGSTTGTAATSAFFVVGGTGGSAGYQGLQKYTYAAGQWETVKLASAVTDQRLGHNAVYLNSTDSILVYGGTQDGSHAASSQTFTIGASAPYSVTSYDAVAPAALNPILLPWSTSEAVMVGGSTTNTKVMLFSQARNWTDSGASLATPLAKDTSSMQAVLMTGDDGSKNLITFDMSVSPNAVKRTVLFSAPTVPVPNAAPVRRRALSRKNSDSKEMRSTAPLNVYDWPAYNSTLAPKATRTNFALAQGADGMVVIAGGNEDDVLCMFDCRQNSWEDAGSKLAQFKVLSTDSSSTSSSATATSTTSSSTLSSSSTSLSSSATSSTSATPSVTDAAAATQTATGTAVPTVSDSSGPPLNTILGAVLGGVFGLAIALVLAYFCIRRQRRRRAHLEAGHLRRASGMSSNEKGGIGFASNSLSLGQGPPGVFRGHQQQGSENSFTGLLMGRNGQKSAPSALSRKSSNDSRRDSGDSTFRAFKSTISKPFPQPSQPATGFRPPQAPARDEKAGVAFTADTAESKPRNITAGPDRRGSTRRSSGWNRYWSGGSALNLLGFGSGNGNNNAAAANNANNNNTSRRTTLRSEGSSAYSDPHRMTQDSATVPPLFPASAAAAAADAPRMSFSRVHSASPTIAVYSGGDKFLKEGLSGRIESSSSRPRPVSALSDESASAYSSGIPESVADAWDPTAANRPWGADRALNTSFTGLYSTALTPASAALGGRGHQQQQQQQGRVGSSSQAHAQQAPVRDDMSWLNLGSAR